MDDLEIRKRILQALYQADRERPQVGFRKKNDLAKEFGVNLKDIEFNASYLERLGFIEYASQGGNLGILPKGINFVEGPSPFNPLREFKSQHIQISGGTAGNVAQGHEISINDAPEFLRRLVAEIETHPEIGSERKERWTESLRQMAGSSAVGEIVRRVIAAIAGF